MYVEVKTFNLIVRVKLLISHFIRDLDIKFSRFSNRQELVRPQKRMQSTHLPTYQTPLPTSYPTKPHYLPHIGTVLVSLTCVSTLFHFVPKKKETIKLCSDWVRILSLAGSAALANTFRFHLGPLSPCSFTMPVCHFPSQDFAYASQF